MMTTENQSVSHHQMGGLKFTLTVMATAVFTMILVPAAVLGFSYLAGGLAASSILFVYIFALFTNGPFLAASFLIATAVLAMPRLVSNFTHHHHA
jgi:hypothetical protein